MNIDFLFNENFWKIAAAPIITFLVGVFTVVNNFRNNRSNNRVLKELKEQELSANIISNARIKWLETVRLHSAELIKNCIAVTSNENITREGDRQENYEDFIKYYYLLKLYYTEKDKENSDNEDHKKIISELDRLYKKIVDEFKYVTEKNGEFDGEGIKKIIDNFTTISSDYFKKVWEEAKDIKDNR